MMTHRSRILMILGVCALLLAAPAVSRADAVLFTNFGPGFSYNTGGGNFVGNGLDGSGNNYAEGDTFTPLFTASFTSLDIALSCFFGAGACAGNLTVSVDNNNAGVPGAALESFSIAAGSLTPFGASNPPLVLTSVGPTVVLTAGTPYWVTVSTSNTANSIVWNWNDTGDMSSEAISTDGGTTWFAPSGLTPGAYEVNAVPEPRTLVLSATVLLLLVVGKLGALLRNR